MSTSATATSMPNQTTAPRQHPTVGREALSILKAGNIRFSEGHAAHPHTDARFRRQLENEQHPLATVLGCSDSRVPPELIFDEGFGDLFVVRVAGNIVDVDVSASVEYAVDHLRAPLLVVLGHEGCGAVTAAIEHLRGKLPSDKEPPEIFSLLSHIEPGLQRLGKQEDLQALVHVAVEENVRHSMQELAKVPDIRKAIATGQLQVVGAIYDLHTGQVRFLEPSLL
jgi:carbonic anhydrase